jgi:hypothetical protein
MLFLACVLAARAWSQEADSQDKKIDVQTPSARFHIGDDADAKKIGLPLYPGARLKSEGDDKDHANLSLLTDAFGMKLIVANYVSEDSPAQVLDFYRGKLKKYGKVLECRSHGGDVNLHDDSKDSAAGHALKCDDDSGPTVELKIGTEDNQRMVAVEPGDGGKGSKLALLYIYTRGKRGDI